MGICLITFFIGCIIFMFGWQFLANKIGKKKCWEYCSLIGFFVYFSSAFLDYSSNPFLILTAIMLCAIPASGAYMNDAIISDIIDYDELITDSRNEGIYTVFTTFIPKLVSLFAQSLPIIVLAGKFYNYKLFKILSNY